MENKTFIPQDLLNEFKNEGYENRVLTQVEIARMLEANGTFFINGTKDTIYVQDNDGDFIINTIDWTLFDLFAYLFKNSSKMEINFIRIKSDINGNPRYVCSIMHFVTQTELRRDGYLELALKRAKSIGGKRYGRTGKNADLIVLQSYNLRQTGHDIINSLTEIKIA